MQLTGARKTNSSTKASEIEHLMKPLAACVSPQLVSLEQKIDMTTILLEVPVQHDRKVPKGIPSAFFAFSSGAHPKNESGEKFPHPDE